MQTNFITKNKISRIKSLEDNIKSHNTMAAFFSNTDMSTLHEQANQCNNVLSIVVNNEGSYVAKFTEKHEIHKDIAVTENITTTDSWKYMGEKEDSNTKYSVESYDKTDDYVEIKCWDCDIDRPLDVGIDEDFEKECIDKKESIKQERKLSKVHKEPSTILQPNLFGEYWNSYEVPRSISTMVASIFSLSFSNYIHSGYWLNDKLNDDLSPYFLSMFMETWFEFYSPDAEEIQEVEDKFSLYTEDHCQYPSTRDFILTTLAEMQESALQ